MKLIQETTVYLYPLVKPVKGSIRFKQSLCKGWTGTPIYRKYNVVCLCYWRTAQYNAEKHYAEYKKDSIFRTVKLTAWAL